MVTLNTADSYLGRWGVKASRGEYDRLIGAWRAGGRCLPKADAGVTVAELALAYLRHARDYYRKNGQPTTSMDRIRTAVRTLRTTYGTTLVKDFGPLALQAVQRRLAESDKCRKYVNYLVEAIKRIFRWGVAQELVPETVYRALTAVAGLRKGHTLAREAAPVRPVSDAMVDATLPHLPVVVADMVGFQRLTGCRPGELCILRPCDVDTSADVWVYRPESHKTEHHDRERTICIGPQAQDVLRSYLLRPADSFCFCPQDSERKRSRQRRETRQTPMTPSQVERRPKRNPRSAPGTHYTPCTYRQCVRRAVEIINRKRTEEAEARGEKPVLLPHWKPNQLRHTAATAIRKGFGLEAAQVSLGHATAYVSEIYAERDLTLAAEVMRKIG